MKGDEFVRLAREWRQKFLSGFGFGACYQGNEAMTEDAELLRCYAQNSSEEAFAELVRRRIDLVYSVARRQVGGDAQLAEDVTQKVFADLARKAAALSGRAVLSGWLYRSAQFAAADVVRAERRRRAREQENQTMEEMRAGADGPADWERLRPVLDQVLGELSEADRDAVALRFFEGRAFAEIGATLRLSEDTARKRVERALEKLRGGLARRGVTSTGAALGLALANQAVMAAPAGLAASVTGAALAGAGGVGAVTIFMGITKTQVALLGALVAAGAGGLTLQQRANAQMAAEVAALRRTVAENETLRGDNQRLARAVTDARALSQSSGAELARLSDEAAALKARLAAEAKSAAAASSRSGGSAKPAAIYDVAQLDQAPRPKFQAMAEYPSEERKKGLEGKVLVEFVLDANGEVTEAKSIEATNEAFAESAVAALKKWKFEPGQKGGAAVGVRMQEPYTFTISKDPAPTNWF